MGWMDSGGGSTPAAPDYRGAALETAQASREMTTEQTHANRPTLNTPWGQMAWSTAAGVDPATGQPITSWTGNVNLTPEQQTALDAQQRIQQGRSTAAETILPQAVGNFQQQFNWAGMPQTAATPQGQRTYQYNMQQGLPQYGMDISAPGQTTYSTNEPAFAAERQRIEQGLFNQMRPEHQFQEDRTRTMLANQGLTPGSQAYNRELERLQGQQANERFNAMQMGGAEQARMQQMLLGQQQQAFGQDVTAQQAQNQAMQGQFGQGLAAGQFYNQATNQAFAQQAASNQQNFATEMQMAGYQNQLRQQAIAEEAQRRGMPLNELNALLSGTQVQTPQMPGFSQAGKAESPDFLSAMSHGYDAQLDAYNANQAKSQGGMSGLFGLGGAALGSFFGPMGTAIGSQIGSQIGK